MIGPVKNKSSFPKIFSVSGGKLLYQQKDKEKIWYAPLIVDSLNKKTVYYKEEHIFYGKKK